MTHRPGPNHATGDKAFREIMRSWGIPSSGVRSMRELHSHKVNKLNQGLYVGCYDGAGSGHEQYVISCDERVADTPPGITLHSVLTFHTGNVESAADGRTMIKGITIEAVLAIVEDRLEELQKGKFPCRENAIALTHLQTAMLFLQKRTMDRVKRGVEGLQEK